MACVGNRLSHPNPELICVLQLKVIYMKPTLLG